MHGVGKCTNFEDPTGYNGKTSTLADKILIPNDYLPCVWINIQPPNPHTQFYPLSPFARCRASRDRLDIVWIRHLQEANPLSSFDCSF